LREHIWKSDKKSAFIREVTSIENTLYLHSDKYFTFTNNKEFLIDGYQYINID